MSEPTHDTDENSEDRELLEPLVRFAAADAVLVLDDGQAIDLNSLANPFTGELPQARADGAYSAESDVDEDAEAAARVGRQLRALREDAGLSLKEIAAHVGVSSARVSQLEKGAGEASLSLITALVRAAGGRLSDIAAPGAPEFSKRSITKIATDAGASRDVVDRIASLIGRPLFPAALSRAFKWRPDELLQGAPRSSAPDVLMAFKSVAAPPAQDAPTLALARAMSEFTVSLHDRHYVGIPSDPEALRREVIAANGAVSLDSLVEWAWGAGVAVMPLIGRGEFSAAVWMIGNTPVIVLKESRAVAAYWLFDLAHELGHLAHGHVDEKPLVDVARVERLEVTDEQEQQANDYALRLLLPDPAALLADVRVRTRGDAPRNFKFAVRDVAAEARVSPGVLGFAAARAMSDVPADKDRWGSAQNLAKDEDPDGRQRVEDAFRRWIRVTGLNDLDATLLVAAALLGSTE
jgi:transcriptional regulator with XRE-family HTH domain/Zn-dependent peptidase ImmA (M78 family)